MDKILIITPDYPPNVFGGIGAHVFQLTKILKEKYEFIVFTVRLKKVEFQFPQIRKEKGITIVDFPTNYEKIVDKYPESSYTIPIIMGEVNYLIYGFLDELMKKNPDICMIHNHFYYFSCVAEILRESYNVPILTTHHFFEVWGNKYNYLNKVKRYSITSSDVNIFVSEWLFNYVQENIDENMIPNSKVIYNGVDDKCLTSDCIQNVKESKVVKILYCGRLARKKGIHVLLKAISLLKSNKTISEELRVEIVGEGQEYNNLLTLVDELNLNDNVVFTGYLEQSLVYEKMREADIMVIPSLEEPFGLVSVEAMASGAVVIASNAGGLKEIIVHNENGLLFEPNDESDLAQKISLVWENEDLKDRLRSGGKLTAKKFDWVQIAKETSQIYDYMIKNINY